MDNQFIDIVFDGPPSNESGRFVEVEDATGSSINFGEWIERETRDATFCVLRIPDSRWQAQRIADLEARLERAERALGEARELFKTTIFTYAKHHPGCDHRLDCSCGYRKAIGNIYRALDANNPAAAETAEEVMNDGDNT